MYESEMVFIEDTPVADYLESTSESEVEVTQPNPHVPAPNVLLSSTMFQLQMRIIFFSTLVSQIGYRTYIFVLYVDLHNLV